MTREPPASANSARAPVSLTAPRRAVPPAGTAPIGRWPPPHIAFLLIAGVNAVVLIVLMPPFQVHDEFQHYFRAYQLSEGHLLGIVRNGVPGGAIPSSMVSFVRRTWGTLHLWKTPPLGLHPLLGTWSAFKQPLAPEKRQFAEFMFAGYSPLFYIPQAIGVGIGRMLGVSPLALLYLGRLANAAASIAAIAWALRRLPVGRASALAIALLPGAQVEFASVAADGGIIASGFVLVALILQNERRESWPWSDVAAAAVAGAVLSCKLVYAPLLAVGVPGVLRAARSDGSLRAMRRLAVPQVITSALALGSALLWLHWSAANLASRMLAPERIVAQKAAILGHPLRFACFLVTDLWRHGLQYYFDTLGVLGAWSVVLPAYVYLCATLALGLSATIARGEEDARTFLGDACWNVVLLGGMVVLIQIAMFVISTPPGVNRLIGVQGRYFLPMGALGATTIALLGRRFRRRGGDGSLYGALLALLLIVSLGLDVGAACGFHVFG